MTGIVRRTLRWVICTLLLASLIAGGLAYYKRDAISTYFALQALHNTRTEDERAQVVSRLTALGEPVVPTLVPMLAKSEDVQTHAVRDVLTHFINTWAKDDPRREQLLAKLAAQFDGCNETGKLSTLTLAQTLFSPGERAFVTVCRPLTELALIAPQESVRLEGIRLALKSGLDLIPKVRPLLHDDSAEVRTAAMIAVGPHSVIISDEDLLHWLHDPDYEVRRLCESALRSRGLSSREIHLGKQLVHRDYKERLKLLVRLVSEDELDLGEWLLRLSTDQAPAVRAGVARVAVEQRVPILERLEEMASTDPDPSVAQIARYWLNRQATLLPSPRSIIPTTFRE